jgi:uncharacterized protein (TIGR04255 family)
MIIDEVLPYPTVKQVIFQITYPDLFYLESKIGNIQQKIMKEFPKSNLIFRKKIFSFNIGMGNPLGGPENVPPEKIWQFESTSGTIVGVSSTSLDINSKSHNTYDSGSDENKKFKLAIKKVVDTFIEETSLPIINRVGLRYIDHCPLVRKNSETLGTWYDSKLPSQKFEIANAETMAFQTKVKIGPYYLGYAEAIAKLEGRDWLLLDFDGSAENINAPDYLDITNELHKLIAEEYAKTIKGKEGPLYKYMKTGTVE